jgi:beta-carotene hydroxylase
MLRYKADRKTVVYMFVAIALLLVQWSLDELNPFLFVLALHMGVAASVIAHNHNHLRTWKSKALNVVTDYWITLFYGFPAFAWIPTHNMNHHKRNNREGDYTITYRLSERNNLFTLLTYPTISGLYQQQPTTQYLRHLWRKRRSRFLYSVSQYVVLAIYLGILFALDWRKALLYAFIPQQFGLMAVLIFNYIQHVHADEESRWNHSRNFVGWALNAFLLNNGYHTIHHEKPGLHWSVLPEEHAKIASQIDPALAERSFWWYMIRVYLLGIFVPRFRTRSMRLARLQTQEPAEQPATPVAA